MKLLFAMYNGSSRELTIACSLVGCLLPCHFIILNIEKHRAWALGGGFYRNRFPILLENTMRQNHDDHRVAKASVLAARLDTEEFFARNTPVTKVEYVSLNVTTGAPEKVKLAFRRKL